MAGLLYRLGQFAARRHWTVVITWVLILTVSGIGYALFHGPVASSITIPGTPTTQVANLLKEKFPSASGGSGSIVFATTNDQAFTEAQRADIADFLKRIKGYDGVRDAVNPFTSQAELDRRREQITDGKSQIAKGKQAISDGRAELKNGQRQLDAAQRQLNTQRAQAKAAGQLALAAPQLDAAQAQLDAQQTKLDDGLKALNSQAEKLTKNEDRLLLGERVLSLSKNFRLVSSDKSAALGTVRFKQATDMIPATLKSKVLTTVEQAKIPGVQVYVTNDITQSVPSVVGPGEIIGLFVAAIVLFLMLSTLLGAALPLVSALLGVGVALLGALSFSSLVEFISVTPVLGIMLGLAVGIDYSLFILNRHRTQLKRGVPLRESIALANGTSGNAVVFAGSTVIVALLALNVTGIPFLGLMGSVGAAAVLVAVLIAVSFTPALLGILGMRILRRGERRHLADKPHADTRPTTPMKTWRAAVTLVAGIAVLGALALPALHMRLGLPDGSSEAENSVQYKAYKTIADKFGEGQNGPLLVVATLPRKATGDALLARQAVIGEQLAQQAHVATVLPFATSADSTLAAFTVIPTTGPTSVGTDALVRDLRALSPVFTPDGGAKLGVAGNASANIDVSSKLADVLPLYLAIVIGLSLLILILVFRSLLVPITATAGFVLSLLATFGGITAIYQFGWLSQIFGVHDPGPILSFLPIIAMGILFGLAMDYQLFLVSGMREAWAHGASAKVAVRQGLHAGRTVVTAAAIIMISVFSGFIFSDSATIRPIGFSLAFGVLMDAFVVRMLLIPAAMHLLGDAAWWLPKWLHRIIPDVDVEGAKLERTHPVLPVEESQTKSDA